MRMFRSLTDRNFALWFSGTFVSNLAVWMQSTAVGWVVLTELTDNDAFSVGLTLALQFGPSLLLVPVTGLVADRLDRRLVQLLARAAALLLTLAIGVLLIRGIAEYWHMLTFALLLGVINAFDAPARQAFVSDLVPTQQIANAVALNSASFNTARLIGPAVAGVMIATGGSGWVFVVNALSFAFVCVTLLFVESAPLRSQIEPGGEPLPGGGRRRSGMFDGFRYLAERNDLVVVFIMVALVGTFGLNFPIYTSTMAVEFGRGPREFGLLSSVLAVGSLTGALLIARAPFARMRVVILASIGFALSTGVAALMPTYLTFAIALVFAGFFTPTMFSTANGFVQTTSDPSLKGRILSMYLAIVQGGTLIGAPVAGWIANTYGARWSLAFGAVTAAIAAMIGVLWLVIARELRVHYVRGEGLRSTHIGRPEVRSHTSRPVRQVETLTAPLAVLNREVHPIESGSLTPHEGRHDATGVIPTTGMDRGGEGKRGGSKSRPDSRSSAHDADNDEPPRQGQVTSD